MIPGLIAAASFLAWLFTTRGLYRHWVKKDTWTINDKTCSHGFGIIHQGEPCHGYHPASRESVMGIAALAALFLPITLTIVFIMHDTPQDRAGLEQKIRELEKEAGIRQ